MNKKDLRIVYMGTPDFAVAPLKVLLENGYNVVGVITMPDKPAGRGYQLQQSPVKKYALEKGLDILQPVKLKDETFIEQLRNLKADLQIVVAFRMLPEIVWNMPPLGTFNLHASLLPQYRGAAPINRAIMNGEKRTGVTTFFLSHEIDTGKIIFREGTVIGEKENAGDIHDRLMQIGADLVAKTVDAILHDNYETTEQKEYVTETETLNEAPKIFKEDCHIDWKNKRKKVYNLIRGLSPYPGAWSEIETPDKKRYNVKIYASECKTGYMNVNEGTIVSDGKHFMDVVVSDGFISITSLQIAGKKRMDIQDFLRGFKIEGCTMV